MQFYLHSIGYKNDVWLDYVRLFSSLSLLDVVVVIVVVVVITLTFIVIIRSCHDKLVLCLDMFCLQPPLKP